MNDYSESTVESRFSRGEWIRACQFEDLADSEVLREVALRVAETATGRPIVLFDLDSTLYEVGPRTYQILKEWVASEESAAFPEVRTSFEDLAHSHIGYSVRDTFMALGLALDEDIHPAWESAKRFWGERFFTSEYLIHDRPYAGAAAFAREIYALGAEVVYLTGRDEPQMGEGTRANLIRDGFPWEVERTHLLLKPDTGVLDLSHKRNAAEYIRAHGILVASFENEPVNLMAIRQLFPEAMHVFVDTLCSDHETHPGRGLYRIRGFAPV